MIRSPAGELGAVAADCVMMTGCPATVSVPLKVGAKVTWTQIQKLRRYAGTEGFTRAQG